MDPLVGTTVAHYDVEARLGGGGMGVVYAARDTKLGRRVALKFLPPQWSHDESAKQRFMREAQAASATDHPNICTIHDIATADDGQLFIVMAHYDGETLKTRLERGRLPVDEARRDRGAGGRRSRQGAQPGRRAPRHQARQPDAHRARRQDSRLRPREVCRRAAEADARRLDDRHDRVHVAGAGARRGSRCAQRRLGGWRRAVRNADRRACRSRAATRKRFRTRSRTTRRRRSGPTSPRSRKRSSSSSSAPFTKSRRCVCARRGSWRARSASCRDGRCPSTSARKCCHRSTRPAPRPHGDRAAGVHGERRAWPRRLWPSSSASAVDFLAGRARARSSLRPS